VTPVFVKQRLALIEASLELQEAVRAKRIPAKRSREDCKTRRVGSTQSRRWQW